MGTATAVHLFGTHEGLESIGIFFFVITDCDTTEFQLQNACQRSNIQLFHTQISLEGYPLLISTF